MKSDGKYIIDVYDYSIEKPNSGGTHKFVHNREAKLHPRIGDHGLVDVSERVYGENGVASTHFVLIEGQDLWAIARAMAEAQGYELVLRPSTAHS